MGVTAGSRGRFPARAVFSGRGSTRLPGPPQTGEPPPKGPISLHLRRLDLAHVRCFTELSLDFQRADGSPRLWTSILGDSGSGKSTILRAALLALVSAEALHRSDSVRHRAILDLVGEELLGGSHRPRGVSAEVGGQDSPHIRAGVQNHLSKSLSNEIHRAPVYHLSELFDPALHVFAHQVGAVGNGAPKRLVFAAYGCSRSLAGGERIRRSLDGFATMIDSASHLTPPEEHLLAIRSQPGSRRRYARTRSMLRSFLPNVERIFTREGKVMCRTPEGRVPLSAIGDGQRNLLALICDLLARLEAAYPNSEKPAGEAATVLIDDIGALLIGREQRL